MPTACVRVYSKSITAILLQLLLFRNSISAVEEGWVLAKHNCPRRRGPVRPATIDERWRFY